MPCKHCGKTDHQRKNSKLCDFYKTKQIIQYDKNLPYLCIELKENIIKYTNGKSINNLIQINKEWYNDLRNENLWKSLLRNITTKIPQSIVSFKSLYISLLENRCINCYKKTSCKCPFYNHIVCQDCKKCLELYKTLTKTCAIKEYYLTETELDDVKCVQIKNPFYSGMMTLYLESDIVKKTYSLHGDKDGFYNFVRMRNQKKLDRSINGKLKKIERRESLKKALSIRNLELRDDSVICQNYIDGNKSLKLSEIVDIMLRMHIIHEHVSFENIRHFLYYECEDYFYYEDVEDIAEKIYNKCCERDNYNFEFCKCGHYKIPRIIYTQVENDILNSYK